MGRLRRRASKPIGRRLAWSLAATLPVACAGAYAAGAPIELHGPRAAPESITSTADGTLYVGGFAQGGVTRIRKGGEPEIWIKPGAYGTRSVLGVLADEAHGRLWVCSNDLSARGVAGPSDVKGSFVKAFDLKTGMQMVSAKLPGDRTLCNDIAIGPDGAAYVTNSLQPDILRLKPGSDTLEVWAHDPQVAPPADGTSGLDGIAFDGKGNVYVDLFVAAQLFRVDVKDGHADRVVHLAPSRPLTLTDAIRPLGDGSYLLIEGAGRLDHLTITGDQAKVDTIKDGFVGPTGATKVGRTAWVSEGRLAEILHPTGMGQTYSAAARYATGIRNGEGYGIDSDGRLYVTQHGRDQLWANWPALFKMRQSAELPAEEVVELKQGGNYGWPECYYDGNQGKLLLALEYGGDGKKIGVCADELAPVAAFPAHWAPNDLMVYKGDMLPSAYKDALFVAFHGSWNRAPAPQGGFNVVVQLMKDGKASGPWLTFADGFTASRILAPPSITRAAWPSVPTVRSTSLTISAGRSTGSPTAAAGMPRSPASRTRHRRATVSPMRSRPRARMPTRVARRSACGRRRGRESPMSCSAAASFTATSRRARAPAATA